MIYSATAKGPVKVPGYHDPNSVRNFRLIFRPATWASGTVYGKRSETDYDVMIPTVFTRLYYKVKYPGKSGGTIPTFNMVAGEETADGTLGLVWEAVNYNLMPIGETITAVTVTATDSVTISSQSNDTVSCDFTIAALPTGLTTFDVLVRITKSNGEKDDVTLRFNVAER